MKPDLNSPMEVLNLEILRSTEKPYFYSISMGYGSAHLVVRLESENVISNILTLISRHAGETKTHWLTLGTFGTYPATLVLNKSEIHIIIDGEDCGDGSTQSFGLHLPIVNASEFLKVLSSEAARYDINTTE